MNPDLVPSIPLFTGISRRRRTQVASLFDEVTLPAGRTLARQGAYADELFVVVDGSADVAIGSTPVGTVGPGDVVGEIGLLAGPARSATVVATSPMRVLVSGPRELARLMHDFPQVADRIRAAFAARDAAVA
jgi:CRP-like cAMP-binding protein